MFEKLLRRLGLMWTRVDCLGVAGRWEEQSHVSAAVAGSVGKSHNFRFHYSLVRTWKPVGRLREESISVHSDALNTSWQFFASRLLAGGLPLSTWLIRHWRLGGAVLCRWGSAGRAVVNSVKMSFLIKNRRPMHRWFCPRGCQIGRDAGEWGLLWPALMLSRVNGYLVQVYSCILVFFV